MENITALSDLELLNRIMADEELNNELFYCCQVQNDLDSLIDEIDKLYIYNAGQLNEVYANYNDRYPYFLEERIYGDDEK